MVNPGACPSGGWGAGGLVLSPELRRQPRQSPGRREPEASRPLFPVGQTCTSVCSLIHVMTAHLTQLKGKVETLISHVQRSGYLHSAFQAGERREPSAFLSYDPSRGHRPTHPVSRILRRHVHTVRLSRELGVMSHDHRV